MILVGRTVLKKTNEDGTRFRARILGYVEEWEGQRNSDPERIKFRAKIGENDFEELIEYNEMCELIEEQSKDENGDWRFLEIVGHTTPKTTRERPKLLVKWESGEITLEPAYNFGKSSSYKWILAGKRARRRKGNSSGNMRRSLTRVPGLQLEFRPDTRRSICTLSMP